MNDPERRDCRHFIGDRPCGRGTECAECADYDPMGTRIVVVKLAAAGDVLRTAAILPPLKREYPRSHVTWVADEAALPLIDGHPLVDRAMPFDFTTWLTLSAEEFDLVLSLDKEPRAAAFAGGLRASERRGFALSRWGTLTALNDGAQYDLDLGRSNDKKFNGNALSAPEIFCGVAGLTYAGEPYELALPDASIDRARTFLDSHALADPVVGLNVGAGPVFANKAWTTEGYGELARRVRDELGGTALVLGGPADRERMTSVVEASDGAAVDGGTHELLDFAAIVGSMDALVTGDTMALHLAVALGVPTVVIFGPTVPQEIELYGRGHKIVSSADCAPCYARSCDRTPSCMDVVTPDEVFDALEEVLES